MMGVKWTAVLSLNLSCLFLEVSFLRCGWSSCANNWCLRLYRGTTTSHFGEDFRVSVNRGLSYPSVLCIREKYIVIGLLYLFTRHHFFGQSVKIRMVVGNWSIRIPSLLLHMGPDCVIDPRGDQHEKPLSSFHARKRFDGFLHCNYWYGNSIDISLVKFPVNVQITQSIMKQELIYLHQNLDLLLLIRLFLVVCSKSAWRNKTKSQLWCGVNWFTVRCVWLVGL
jgi:hypothetical protein